MGSLLAGMAIDSASVGAVHAMAHQLGAVYDLPHGVCNGILLPIVVEFNGPAASERYGRIAALFGGGADRPAAPGAAPLAWATGWACRGACPSSGVDRARIPELAARAMTDMCMAHQPAAA